MIYYLTSGVFCYAKRSTKQTIYAGERWERIYLEEGPEGLSVERRGRSSTGRSKKLPKEVEENLLADTKRKGAEVVFTTGGAQSNHAC